MNALEERIPLLLSQAKTRSADRKAYESSLRSAEQILLDTRITSVAARFHWNDIAKQIANTWYFITSDADKVEYCLRKLIGRDGNTRAWTEMVSSLRLALNAKWFERTWDYRTLKYLVMAEEIASSCQDWCNCAFAWSDRSENYERALSCLIRAESMANSFADFLACARNSRLHEEYEWLKLKHWSTKASEQARTSYDWLMCAELVAKVDVFETKRCLAEAEDKATSRDGHILCAFKIDWLMGAREFATVLRCLYRAERSRRNREDWSRQVLAGYYLRHRAEHVHEPVLGVANREAFETYYRHCLQSLRDLPPQTQDWLRIVDGLRWEPPRTIVIDFIRSAEEVAQSAQDWMDCAAAWSSFELPNNKQYASVCRLRALRMEKPMRLPRDVR